MKKISFIVPIYNEEESIPELYKQQKIVLDNLQPKYDYEICFINDGSKDGSLDKLIQLHEQNKKVSIINFSRNFGHQTAITAGLDFVRGDATIIMDADLQDPPKVCLDLIAKWEEGYEVVYAQRKTRQDIPFKKFTSFLFYRILEIFADIKIPKDTGDFRLMDKKVVEALKKFRESNRFMRGLVSYVGFKQTGVLFDRNERFAGQTHYPLRKMIKLAFDGITSFSTVPLRMISQLGFLISFLSFLGIIYALFIRIFVSQAAVPGWAFTITCVLFIGGVQLIMMGVLGTYIGRIYTEVQDRPLYIISSIYSDNGSLQGLPEQK